MTYQPHLDGIRAICVLITISNHIAGGPWFINGTVGVDVFFALSGLLITSILFEEKRKSGTICVSCFYIRRVFRIVPLYALTIVLYAAAAFVILKVSGSDAKLQEFNSALPYLLTFNAEYRAVEDGTLFGHAWSIGIEEKFYIIFPVFMLLLLQGRRWLALSLVLTAVGLLLVLDFGWLMARGYVAIAFACLVALVTVGSPQQSRRSVLDTGWLPLAAMTAFYVASLHIQNPVWNILIACAAALLMRSMHLDEKSTIRAVLALPVLAWVGRLSYGIYLFHVLVQNVCEQALARIIASPPWELRFAVTVLLCILLTSVLRVTIEAPMIAIGRQLASPRKRPAANAI